MYKYGIKADIGAVAGIRICKLTFNSRLIVTKETGLF
jgi:hypothetical protein